MQRQFVDAGKVLQFKKWLRSKYGPIMNFVLGAEIVTVPGETICEAALREGIKIEHACEMSCACTTCHCIIRKGFDSLEEASDIEEDMLDKAWGLEQTSRLSCQTIPPADENIEIELPKYNINMVSEDH